MYIQTRFSSRFCLFNDQMGPLSQLLKKKQWIRWVTWADPQNGGGSKRLKLKALFIQCSFEECFSVRIFIHQHFTALWTENPILQFGSMVKIWHTTRAYSFVLCFSSKHSFRSIIYASIEKCWSILFGLRTLTFWESTNEIIFM